MMKLCYTKWERNGREGENEMEEIRKLQEMIDKAAISYSLEGSGGFYGEQYPGFPQ